jgi:phage terminase large subunit-like protein
LTPQKLRALRETLSDDTLAKVRYQWVPNAEVPLGMARRSQIPPDGDWFIWYIRAGRGWGKNRTGSEWARSKIEGGARYGGVVGPTVDQTRNLIVDGSSGLIQTCPPWNRPHYNGQTHKIVWTNPEYPTYGAVVEVFSAGKPDRIRGANLEFGWADEFATWKDRDPFDQFILCVRIGGMPQLLVTGTPKPLPHVRALPNLPRVVVTQGSTFENEANLTEESLEQYRALYEGTRLGRQELYGELLDDVEGALWTQTMIEASRVTNHPDLERIVVAVDPEAGAGETGLVVFGTAMIGQERHGYVLADDTLHGSPETWAKAAIAAYHKHHADRIVYEKNQGGEMVASVLRTVDPTVPLKDVWASRGKQTRAEPVAALWEQGRCHMVGYFGELESELCSWVPGQGMASPNRLDACVWGVTELMLEPQSGWLDPNLAEKLYGARVM